MKIDMLGFDAILAQLLYSWSHLTITLKTHFS